MIFLLENTKTADVVSWATESKMDMIVEFPLSEDAKLRHAAVTNIEEADDKIKWLMFDENGDLVPWTEEDGTDKADKDCDESDSKDIKKDLAIALGATVLWVLIVCNWEVSRSVAATVLLVIGSIAVLCCWGMAMSITKECSRIFRQLKKEITRPPTPLLKEASPE